MTWMQSSSSGAAAPKGFPRGRALGWPYISARRERRPRRSAERTKTITAPRRIRTILPSVILSEQSESKNLRICRLLCNHSVRRSFGFGLRPSLRMTNHPQTLKTLWTNSGKKPPQALAVGGFPGKTAKNSTDFSKSVENVCWWIFY